MVKDEFVKLSPERRAALSAAGKVALRSIAKAVKCAACSGTGLRYVFRGQLGCVACGGSGSVLHEKETHQARKERMKLVGAHFGKRRTGWR